MKTGKILILILFLLDWSGRVEAQRAFLFDQSRSACDSTTFSINEYTVELRPRTGVTVTEETLYGWFTIDDSETPLFGGSRTGAFTVGQAGPTLAGNVHTLVFRSSDANTGERFEDILTVEVVQRPQILVEFDSICYGEDIVLSVDFRQYADAILWIDEETHAIYSDGHVLTATENRRFSVLATNGACYGVNSAQMFVNIDVIPLVDTNTMILWTMYREEICPGCRRNLSDLLVWQNTDTLIIDHSTWTRNGTSIDPLNLDSEIESPPPGRLQDVYQGWITGRLYRSNTCATFTRSLINVPITLEITREDCQFRARWYEYPNVTRLFGGACIYHLIEIVNPRPNVLTVGNVDANIQITSNNNFPVRFLSANFDGTDRIYQFTYRPENDDTLTITVTYRNICCARPNESFTFTRTLFFETDERIEIDERYCRTDSFDLVFGSNRIFHPIYLVIDSVNILYPYTDSFHLIQSASNVVTFRFKDTIHSWGDRFIPRAIVHYTYCDVAKTDTIDILPQTSSAFCHPFVDIASFECMGDTNFIFITENRRPNARIAYIDWRLMPSGVQLLGDLDTISIGSSSAQFRQRFITYTRDPIRFEIRYLEAQFDTLIEVVVLQRIWGACTPLMQLRTTSLCRGEETHLEIQLRNRNGRVISVDWGVAEGRSYFHRDSIDESPIHPPHLPPSLQAHRIYHYTARFQKATDLNVVVTYNFGDSISEHAFSLQRIHIRDCRAEIWQEAANQTYCDGEIARFEIRPHPNTLDTIVRVVWDYIYFSPMIHDSTNRETGTWHFYTNVLRDTTFTAFVQKQDFWGDNSTYVLSDDIIVRPFPRVWRQRTIDVCENEPVNLDSLTNGVREFWNPEFITRVNFAMPPFNNPNATAWLSGGDSVRQFVVQAEAHFQCASMGGTNLVYDTIYLRRNIQPSFRMVRFCEDGICVNDTLWLEIEEFAIHSTVTWIKGDDTIFRDRSVLERLFTIVTEATYYTVISATACGAISDSDFLRIVPAPTLTLPPDKWVCLHDSALLYLPHNPHIVGVPQWHVGDMMHVGHDFHLQINDADNPTVVTVLARGDNDCNAKGMVTITPIALPNVEIGRNGIFSDTVSCEPIESSFILNVKYDPDLQFTWVYPTPAGNWPSNALTKAIDAITTPTTFRIEGLDPNTGCRNFANFHVVILENDTNFNVEPNGILADDRACIHANFAFEAEYVPNMLHTWRTLYGRDVHSRFLTIYNVVPADIGSYRLIRSLHTCRDTSWLNIDLMPFPNLQFSGLSPSYCVGNTVEFWTVPASGVYYFWRDPFGDSIAAHHYKLTDISLAHAGNFVLRTMYNNCWHYDTLRIQVFPLPIIDTTAYYYLCEGFTLTMNLYRPNATYRWCRGDETPTFKITTGGYYTVTITENNCSTTATFSIEDRPTPIFRLPNDTAICWNDPRIAWQDAANSLEGRSVIVGAIGMDQTNNVEFSWTKNAQLLSQSDRFEIIYAGVYTLTTELDGCRWSDSIRITNVFCDLFVMPNAFRPGSQIYPNHSFGPARAFPEDLVTFEMFIYDQWGRRVFRTNDQNIRWDGQDMNGRDVQPGVFIWRIRAHETLGGQDLSEHGTVTLIR